MRTQFLIALVLVAALLPGAAIAQQGAENTTVVQQEEDPTDGCDVRIDRVTRLCEASFDNGRIELVLYSNATQSVTLTDMGARGHVPRERRTLQKGRNRVSIDATERNNKAGVGITTDRVLFRHIVKSGSPLIAGPFDGDDVRNGSIASAVWVMLVVIVQAIRHMTGRDDGPERIA
jgi:hypothetical protein